MEARYNTPQGLFDGEKQFVIPLFQRPYSWTQKQWSALWEDLIYLTDGPGERPHFIGSLVMLPTSAVPAGVSKYAVIDGQQRLTTLALLLLALRDTATQHGQPRLAARIGEVYLTNKYASHDYERYKLLPTQADRPAFRELAEGLLADGAAIPATASRLHLAYAFFRQRLSSWLRSASQPELGDLLEILLRRFALVSITLDERDDPYLVFESLNAKGLQLTAADLIRNYLFMRLPQQGDEQELFNQRYWEPMQQQLGEYLTPFIFHYLLMRQGGQVRQTEVYLEFKKLAEGKPVEQVLRELSQYAPYYARLLRPELETARPAIRQALARLARLNFIVAYPLALRLYYGVGIGTVAEATLLAVLTKLENYVLRRFIAGRGTQGSNRSLQALTQRTAGLDADPEELINAINVYLATQNYPDDETVRLALLTGKLYHPAGERATRTRLLLDTLEADLNPREQVNSATLTIEHIMPQALTPAWRTALGPEAERDHELLLHTLGNLTLTGYNSELSNAPFEAKRLQFAQSNVALNAELAPVDNWDIGMQRLSGRVVAGWQSGYSCAGLPLPPKQQPMEKLPESRQSAFGR